MQGADYKIVAIQLLTHYFKTVWEKAGLKWTRDNDAEIEDLVDALMRIE